MSSLAVLQKRGAIVRPIAPFRVWVARRIVEQRAKDPRNPHVRTAEALGVSTRRLYEWLHEWEYIDEADVDKAVTRDGRFSLNDIYGYGPVVEDVVALPPDTECAAKDCAERRNGGRFCHEHTELLARIRAEYEAEGALMCRSGGAPKRLSGDRPRTKPQPTCCNPHCWNPRVGGAAFCETCEADGWIEEEE